MKICYKKKGLAGFLLFLTISLTGTACDDPQLWDKTYGSSSKDETVAAMVQDNQGNPILAGSLEISRDGNYNTDFLFLKYNSDGDLLWSKTYHASGANDLGQNNSRATALTVDAERNVYAAGSTTAEEFNHIAYDSFLFKYSPAGELLWSVRRDGQALDILHHNNAVYVTGDYTAAYNANTGALLWEEVYNDSEHGLTGGGRKLSTGPQGNLYVAGFLEHDLNDNVTSNDLAVFKYDVAAGAISGIGQRLWTYKTGVYRGRMERANGIIVDQNSGAVYAVGVAYHDDTSYDCLTIKLSDSGALTWEKRYDNPDINDDRGEDIKLDSQGNVIIASLSEGNFEAGKINTLKYDPAGNLLWQQSMNAIAASMWVYTPKVYVNSQDQIFTTGQDKSVKYSAAGVAQSDPEKDLKDKSKDNNFLIFDDVNGFAYRATTEFSGLIVQYANIRLTKFQQ